MDASRAPAREEAQPRKRRPAQAAPVHPAAGPSLTTLQFPGCKPYRLTREQIGDFEGRLEFWDAATETAWVCEPTSPYHEAPSQTLSALADRIASVRGSPIKCYGAMDLLLRDEDGEARRIMQADQSVYLRPGRAKLPGPAAMVIGEHDFPDVVLEVDHSTDVRRGKLRLYEAWGFPEVWVEVPEHRAPSRSTGRRPGLTIHRLERGVFRVSEESGAFPGWTAEEIHAAMNETSASARTYAVIERVGEVLGAREGTGPDDDPLLRAQRRRGFDEGRVRVQSDGRASSWCAGSCCPEASRSRSDSPPPSHPRSPNGRETTGRGRRSRVRKRSGFPGTPSITGALTPRYGHLWERHHPPIICGLACCCTSQCIEPRNAGIEHRVRAAYTAHRTPTGPLGGH